MLVGEGMLGLALHTRTVDKKELGTSDLPRFPQFRIRGIGDTCHTIARVRGKDQTTAFIESKIRWMRGKTSEIAISDGYSKDAVKISTDDYRDTSSSLV
ncbi:hypothetical protein PROFUN_10097 [Planoprotostelium fungivorum]|uniref:Uncharacterized protein n=1 Tax=Planoprotostelium fungivorum TaxID=1890364 RepID=A0A2P6NEZ6_9EUKA|nr:hypothetical protein PROFUN_10097 [Planoprotostelium fungivorum]